MCAVSERAMQKYPTMGLLRIKFDQANTTTQAKRDEASVPTNLHRFLFPPLLRPTNCLADSNYTQTPEKQPFVEG